MGGDHIEVPLASALFEGLVYNCEQIENYPARYKSPREVELDRRRVENLPLNLSYADLGEFLDPFYRTYRYAEGRGPMWCLAPSSRIPDEFCMCWVSTTLPRRCRISTPISTRRTGPTQGSLASTVRRNRRDLLVVLRVAELLHSQRV